MVGKRGMVATPQKRYKPCKLTRRCDAPGRDRADNTGIDRHERTGRGAQMPVHKGYRPFVGSKMKSPLFTVAMAAARVQGTGLRCSGAVRGGITDVESHRPCRRWRSAATRLRIEICADF